MAPESRSEQDEVVVYRLFSPRTIQLISGSGVVFAVIMFWIGLTLPEPVSRFSWVAFAGFVGTSILSLWGFAIAARRDWWIRNREEEDGPS